MEWTILQDEGSCSRTLVVLLFLCVLEVGEWARNWSETRTSFRVIPWKLYSPNIISGDHITDFASISTKSIPNTRNASNVLGGVHMHLTHISKHTHTHRTCYTYKYTCAQTPLHNVTDTVHACSDMLLTFNTILCWYPCMHIIVMLAMCFLVTNPVHIWLSWACKPRFSLICQTLCWGEGDRHRQRATTSSDLP